MFLASFFLHLTLIGGNARLQKMIVARPHGQTLIPCRAGILNRNLNATGSQEKAADKSPSTQPRKPTAPKVLPTGELA